MKTIFALLASSFGLFAMSCDGEVDRITDCEQICSRYADCFDGGYDVSGCRSDCRNNADDDANFDQHVDNCENCLDDKSCASATFSCAAECTGIVP